MKALVQAKRFGNLLNEALDLSRQLAEAVDRDDTVAVQMLVAMRQEPIDKLMATEQALEDQITTIPDPDEAARLSALLEGGPAETAEEQLLADQVAANRRRLKQVLELDRVVNRKVTREKSIYS